MTRLACAALLAVALAALAGCTRFVDLTRGRDGGGPDGLPPIDAAFFDGPETADAQLPDDGGPGPLPDAFALDAGVRD